MKKLLVVTTTIAVCVCLRVTSARSATGSSFFSAPSQAGHAYRAETMVAANTVSLQTSSPSAGHSTVHAQNAGIAQSNPEVKGCGEDDNDCPPGQCHTRHDDKGAKECRKHKSDNGDED